MEKVFAITPLYNEQKNIKKHIELLHDKVDYIIAVDDGSKDNSFKILEELQQKYNNLIIVKHITNLGKGLAMLTGSELALLLGADYLIYIDSDLQHDHNEIKLFIDELKKGYDLVLGVRKFNKQMPFVFRFGNLFLNTALKLIYGLKVKDSQSGYRALTSKAFKKIRWDTNGYFVETEMLINAKKNNLKIKEIFIKTKYNDNYKGTSIFDGFNILFKMILLRFKRLSKKQ